MLAGYILVRQTLAKLELAISTRNDQFKIMKILNFLILFLLLTFSRASGALTVLHHVGTTGVNGGLTLTVPATGNGNLLVVIVAFTDGVTVTSVSDGTNNFIQFPNAYVNSGTYDYFAMDVWYLPSSVSGKTTITLNNTCCASFIDFEYWEVSGLTSPRPDVVASMVNGAQSGGLATGAAVTPANLNEFILAGDVTGGTVTGNPAGGNEFTSGGDIVNGDGYISYISTSTASAQPVWTDSGAQFTSVTAAFTGSASRAYFYNAKIKNAKFGI